MKCICAQVQVFGFKDHLLSKKEFAQVLEIDEGDLLTEQVGVIIKVLWEDKAVRMAWDRRSEYYVIESNAAYFAKIDSISAFGYVPHDEDILISRARTTGIVDETYVIDTVTFVIIDVGGQRNERKKWIHCFEDVKAVIYVAALSEYDQLLFEDLGTNRMVEFSDFDGEEYNYEHGVQYFEEEFHKRNTVDKHIAVVSARFVLDMGRWEGVC